MFSKKRYHLHTLFFSKKNESFGHCFFGGRGHFPSKISGQLIWWIFFLNLCVFAIFLDIGCFVLLFFSFKKIPCRFFVVFKIYSLQKIDDFIVHFLIGHFAAYFFTEIGRFEDFLFFLIKFYFFRGVFCFLSKNQSLFITVIKMKKNWNVCCYCRLEGGIFDCTKKTNHTFLSEQTRRIPSNVYFKKSFDLPQIRAVHNLRNQEGGTTF